MTPAEMHDAAAFAAEDEAIAGQEFRPSSVDEMCDDDDKSGYVIQFASASAEESYWATRNMSWDDDAKKISADLARLRESIGVSSEESQIIADRQRALSDHDWNRLKAALEERDALMRLDTVRRYEDGPVDKSLLALEDAQRVGQMLVQRDIILMSESQFDDLMRQKNILMETGTLEECDGYWRLWFRDVVTVMDRLWLKWTDGMLAQKYGRHTTVAFPLAIATASLMPKSASQLWEEGADATRKRITGRSEAPPVERTDDGGCST